MDSMRDVTEDDVSIFLESSGSRGFYRRHRAEAVAKS